MGGRSEIDLDFGLFSKRMWSDTDGMTPQERHRITTMLGKLWKETPAHPVVVWIRWAKWLERRKQFVVATIYYSPIMNTTR